MSPTVARSSNARVLLALGAVSLLALVLRVAALDTNPPEPFEDEITVAMSAWKIVTTGSDFEQTKLPFLITRLEMVQPAYGMSTVPFQVILGHSVWAMRLPAALFGTASVLLTAWVMRSLGRPRREAIIAAALMAVLPWAIHYGRVGWQPAAFLPPTLAGVVLLWTGIRNGRRGRIIGAGVVFAVGSYTYHPAVFVNALLALIIVITNARRLDRERLLSLGFATAAALIVLTPYIAALLSEPLFTERTRSISVFANGITIDALGQMWRNYWEQWNPQWLAGADPPNLRNHPGPVLNWTVLTFLAVGVAVSTRRFSRPDRLLLAWLVIGPIPAALTNDGTPHFTRGLAALPVVAMLAAGGVEWTIRMSSAKRGLVGTAAAGAGILAAALFISETVSFLREYYAQYPAASASAWSYGTSDAADAVRRHLGPGDVLCVDGAISYWTFPQMREYHFGSEPFDVLEGTGDPRCTQPGAHLLRRADSEPMAGTTTVVEVAGYGGEPLFQIVRAEEDEP